MATCASALGTRTWYVDARATGANTGTSWVDAWNSLYFAHQDSNNVAPGDFVYVKGGDYVKDRETSRNGEPLRLKGGTTGNWTHYYFTNGVAKFYCMFIVKGFTEINGAANANYSTIIGNNTYLVPMITNNCNLWIYRWTNWWDVNSVRSLLVQSVPVQLSWIHITGATNRYSSDPDGGPTSASACEIFCDISGMSVTNELSYLWVEHTSGNGAGAVIAPYGGAAFDSWNIHHCLFEKVGSDGITWSPGIDFHHSIIRDREGHPLMGCNDTFFGGPSENSRIHHNLIEPTDNDLFSFWYGTDVKHDFYFYDNILMPPRVPVQPSRGNPGFGQAIDAPTTNLVYISTNMFFANNTLIAPAYDHPNGFITLSSNAKGKAYGYRIQPGAWVIKNNLSVRTSVTNAPDIVAPFSFSPGTNDQGYSWQFSSNSWVMDYNLFCDYRGGNLRVGSFTESGLIIHPLANAADIQRFMGYSHNVSMTNTILVDANNFDYRPASSAVSMGQDLTSLKNYIPDIDLDIYGKTRPVGSAWSAGAIEYAPITLTAPSIVVQPSSQSSTVGSNVTFAVTAAGSSPLSYQWSLYGGAIGGATLSSYTLQNIGTNNGGSYRVAVSNPYGAVTSGVATLTVTVPSTTNTPPTITSQPANLSAVQGSSAIFSVSAVGSSPLTYQWTFNGGTIGGATQTSFTLNNVSTNDAGNYAVVVSNPYGSATSQTASLTVSSSSGSGAGSVTNGLVLWLTFDANDWKTNSGGTTGFVVDHSGWANNAQLFDYTGWPTNTWPARTNGPSGLSAAQFTVNYFDGSYHYGTYMGVTNFNGGLATFTKGTWALWISDDTASGTGYHSWLNTGYSPFNTWRFFGQYYDKSYPGFCRTIQPGEGDPQFFVQWPAITDTTWRHYAVTWDGTNFVGYLNGAAYSTNGPGGTNMFTGSLISTNDNPNPAASWIGIGVATHNGTYIRTDPDGYPNHGQLCGCLADIRVYNRPLSATEINTIYSGSAVVSRPSAPTGLHILGFLGP